MKQFWPLLGILSVLIVFGVETKSVRVESAPIVAEYVPVNSFAADLCAALGNSSPSPGILAFIDAWVRAEGMPSTANNPLATTQPSDAVVGIWNSHGVKLYATYEAGLDATVATLVQGYEGYSEIVAGIQTNDARRTLAGLAASPWGTNPSTVRTLLGE